MSLQPRPGETSGYTPEVQPAPQTQEIINPAQSAGSQEGAPAAPVVAPDNTGRAREEILATVAQQPSAEAVVVPETLNTVLPAQRLEDAYNSGDNGSLEEAMTQLPQEVR